MCTMPANNLWQHFIANTVVRTFTHCITLHMPHLISSHPSLPSLLFFSPNPTCTHPLISSPSHPLTPHIPTPSHSHSSHSPPSQPVHNLILPLTPSHHPPTHPLTTHILTISYPTPSHPHLLTPSSPHPLTPHILIFSLPHLLTSSHPHHHTSSPPQILIPSNPHPLTSSPPHQRRWRSRAVPESWFQPIPAELGWDHILDPSPLHTLILHNLTPHPLTSSPPHPLTSSPPHILTLLPEEMEVQSSSRELVPARTS